MSSFSLCRFGHRFCQNIPSAARQKLRCHIDFGISSLRFWILSCWTYYEKPRMLNCRCFIAERRFNIYINAEHFEVPSLLQFFCLPASNPPRRPIDCPQTDTWRGATSRIGIGNSGGLPLGSTWVFDITWISNSYQQLIWDINNLCHKWFTSPCSGAHSLDILTATEQNLSRIQFLEAYLC